MSIAKAAEQLLRLSVEASKVGLEVNTEKTEYMCVNVCENADLMSLNGKRINKVSDLIYLGSKVSSTKNDLAHRRSLAWAAFKKLDKIWLAKHVSVKLRVNIRLRNLDIDLDKDLETQLNSFGLHCHRRILGISLLDHVTRIYAQVGQLPLLEIAQ